MVCGATADAASVLYDESVEEVQSCYGIVTVVDLLQVVTSVERKAICHVIVQVVMLNLKVEFLLLQFA